MYRNLNIEREVIILKIYRILDVSLRYGLGKRRHRVREISEIHKLRATLKIKIFCEYPRYFSYIAIIQIKLPSKRYQIQLQKS